MNAELYCINCVNCIPGKNSFWDFLDWSFSKKNKNNPNTVCCTRSSVKHTNWVDGSEIWTDLLTCKNMRCGDCGKEGKFFTAK